ncbi:MAG: UDP-N-acetylmuramate dehydrogenase [Phycisphaerales bacterium]|nr:UDP-N-acetylmuramate dehydrogenase [Phycisphaerales bacterium]
MTPSANELVIEHNAAIDTWFHIGGRAQRLARPESTEELLQCLSLDDRLLMLGEGANLLVDDDGVKNLVVSLQTDGFCAIEIDDATGIVRTGAGAALPRVIAQTVNAGLGGLEVLAGIPATIGGAAVMNAGGSFGSFADHVLQVEAIDRLGRTHTIARRDIDYDYRQSLLNHLLITAVVFQLDHADPEELKNERTKCMEYKAKTQPMSEKSAGCVFKNPVLVEDLDGIGRHGERVSAGLLIDRAGCKGMSVGGAEVSHIHANFITTKPDAAASSVIDLIERVQQRVLDAFGVALHRELVIWTEREIPR